MSISQEERGYSTQQTGEPGVIVNGFSYDPDQGGWTEYEVETDYGIERWNRSDFILFSEFEEDN